MSFAAVQATEIRVGFTSLTVSTGAGLGAVVSGGVVYETVLLEPDRLPAASTAYTENEKVVFGIISGRVSVVRGGSTRMQPEPLVCTQYQKFFELSVDAFQASETDVGVVAVMRRPLGVVGGVRSRGAALTFESRPSARTAQRTKAVRRGIGTPCAQGLGGALTYVDRRGAVLALRQIALRLLRTVAAGL